MLLENFGFRRKAHVSISISSNNFVELVYIDEQTKTVARYASGTIKYNTALREVMDPAEFAEVVAGLFEDVNLDPADCAVTLNIPNVQFGTDILDNPSDKSAVMENITDNLQDLYIFKKKDPAIRYVAIDNPNDKSLKTIVYSAVQEKAIFDLISILDEIGANLVRVETANCALLRSLFYCDRFNRFIKPGVDSIVLLINPISCTSFFLRGQSLGDVMEEPLALKSFSIEEIYSVITKIANTAISKHDPGALLVISETDEIDAEDLAKNINFKGEIDFINKNAKQNDDFIEIADNDEIDSGLASYITIEAVGAAVSDYYDFNLDLNFLPSERIPQNTIKIGELEGNLFVYLGICVVLGIAAALIIVAIAKMAVSTLTADLNGKAENSAQKISELNNRKTMQGDQKESIFPVLQTVNENNKAVIDAYIAISTEIPEDIYIKKFVANPQGGIGILGESRTSDAVNTFIKGLKEKNDNLMVSKLSLNDQLADPSVALPNGVTFEIKTSNADVYFTNDLLDNQTFQNSNNSNNPSEPPVI